MGTSHKGMSIAERRQEIRDNLAGTGIVLAIGGDGATRYRFGLPTCRECGCVVNPDGETHRGIAFGGKNMEHDINPTTDYFEIRELRTFNEIREAEAFSEGVALATG